VSDATTPRLKVSREGIVLIKSFEGFRPRAVRDDDGGWVIGYGHTLSAREGLTVSEQDAELLLQYDLLPVVKALNEQVSAPLNQHQFDALASFAVSVGVERFLASDVLQRLNQGLAGEAADALIGWPEQTPPDARLRRRAAERALFVADPASPMHLADLLAAPLPPPPIEDAAQPDAEPEPGEAAEARAAAVASLLGETGAAAAPEPDAPTHPEPAAEAPAFEATAFATAPTVTTIHLQRYSAYAPAIVGPLPGFPTAQPKPEREAEPGPEPAPRTDVGDEATPGPETPPGPPMDVAPTPVVPLVPPAPGASPFPPMPVDEPLVLTPATEADFVEAGRPVWEPDQRAEPAAPQDDTVLFEDEPTLSVLRHEAEPSAPRRFDWSVTGAFLIMGVTGLTACAAAAAAFRKAMLDDSSLNDYVVIGWVLALIGVICVGVSSWNLFVRWGRRD